MSTACMRAEGRAAVLSILASLILCTGGCGGPMRPVKPSQPESLDSAHMPTTEQITDYRSTERMFRPPLQTVKVQLDTKQLTDAFVVAQLKLAPERARWNNLSATVVLLAVMAITAATCYRAGKKRGSNG